MTITKGALAVDLKGLAQLVERRGKSFAVLELIQNAWDESGVTRVEIAMRYLQPGRVQLTIEDDAPEGFADLRHAFTLFAPSRKKADAEKRGRFNLGEKLVIALCNSFSLSTTTGGVDIDVVANTRRIRTFKRERGSLVSMVLRMGRDEMAESIRAFRTLIPPRGLVTTLNGEALQERKPVATFDATLASEIADREGFLRPTRRQTPVAVYVPRVGETATLYEMGIPVVETGDAYHVNVFQKVPLNVDRDNVPPAFLRDVRALVLNAMASTLTPEQSAASWVSEALEDDLVSRDAVVAVMDGRFGRRRAILDPSDPEANRIAISKGYTLISGGALSGAAWDHVREFGAALPAGQVTPSPKPFSEDGKPLSMIDPGKYTDEQRVFVAAVEKLHQQLVGSSIRVKLTKEFFWKFGACYGGGELTVNVSRCKSNLDNEETIALVLHEFGHYYGQHLTHAFDDGIARVAARYVLLTRREKSK